MTRETKIGLLVGLAFIIVIGILLSEHFQMEPPQAVISTVATSVREGVNAPGTSNPPIVVYAPPDAPPRQTVPTHDDLTPPVRPVVPSNPAAINPPQQNNGSTVTGNQTPANQGANTPPVNNSGNNIAVNPPATIPPSTPPQAHGPASIDNALAEVAHRNGEDLVPLDPNGRPAGDDSNIKPPASPLVPTANGKTYKVQPGDTVSKLAGRFLGGNTKANRQAIVDANPSLKDDPNKLIVGVAYVIPNSTGASTSAPVVSIPSNPVPLKSAPVVPSQSPQYIYTAADGDSLWRIANDELGDPSAVDAIKELNLDVLKGKNHDVVITGMKLRLPAKPIASAN
jgi:nucleoid-associated protein YgaU